MTRGGGARDERERCRGGRGEGRPRRARQGSRRRGHAYFWEGRCEHCGATVSVGSGWSSCPGVRDARHVACSGPGTAVLTEIEIETERAHELAAAAVREFGRNVADAMRKE
ncbi:hypothetical protein HFP15_40050 [Amycolatopsis sp. K13G38]|uniref:Uncharacterized protein n=1 Tax=Amycolatopsis acididurans TaxID=2724524 RepID=A0ABX1JH35_9PSEU|nr:hypothetical protein [Amycolatopsis acididurans]NKQ59054.1 hypothetical protein [Amycolatopsis acididurans]